MQMHILYQALGRKTTLRRTSRLITVFHIWLGIRCTSLGSQPLSPFDNVRVRVVRQSLSEALVIEDTDNVLQLSPIDWNYRATKALDLGFVKILPSL